MLKREKRLIYIRKRDWLAWCAGFFDGEGCFYVVKSGRNKYIRAVVTQKDRRLLERFINILGFGKIGKPNSRGIHQVAYSNVPQVFMLYEHLAPYLGPQKTEQFQTKLAEYLTAKQEVGRVRI